MSVIFDGRTRSFLARAAFSPSTLSLGETDISNLPPVVGHTKSRIQPGRLLLVLIRDTGFLFETFNFLSIFFKVKMSAVYRV